MNEELRLRIIGRLTKFLNRPPTESEIMNGQSDSNLMSWIQSDVQNETKSDIQAIAVKTNVDLPSKIDTV